MLPDAPRRSVTLRITRWFGMPPDRVVPRSAKIVVALLPASAASITSGQAVVLAEVRMPPPSVVVPSSSRTIPPSASFREKLALLNTLIASAAALRVR